MRSAHSTTQLTDTTGAVTDSYTYDVFGAVTAHTAASAQPFTFTGQQQDAGAARGLVYLRARTYDPALGRFLTQDPLPPAPYLLPPTSIRPRQPGG